MILGISTSGPFCGAALFAQGAIVAACHEELAKGQAERLMPMVDELLAGASARYDQLDAIGVGAGPGNFTGIRIAVSAARGLALGLGIPAVGVSSLEAMALDHATPLLCSIKAGRDNLFVQRFGEGTVRGPDLVSLTDLDSWAQPGLTCTGDSAEDIAATLGAIAAPPPHPPAEAIARIAATRWQDAPARPAPLYLRPADAAPGRDTPPVILP